VHAVEITELSPDRYAERKVPGGPVVKPGEKGGWNENGMHHVDPHQLADGSWLACVDGKRYLQKQK
jgi:hypothetical protein